MPLTDEQKTRIVGLANGTIAPENGMEKHFVAVCSGSARACSPLEKRWFQYWEYYLDAEKARAEKEHRREIAKRDREREEILSRFHDGKLTETEVEEAWERKDDLGFDNKEQNEVRAKLREIKGIKEIGDVRSAMTFCPRCSLPTSNCTCERGWW